jgi:type II secretory pathway component PulF
LAYVFLPLAGIVAVFFLGRFFLLRSPWGQLAWTRFMYGIPGVGTLMRSARMAAFTELLAILLDHEAPLPEALQLAGAASSDPILTSMSRQVQQELAEGKPLSEVLRRSGAVPELVAWMTGLGEQRGMVAKSLHQVADVYRRQSEMRALMVQSVLPSFFIIAVGGLLVALFILALMLPLVRLLDDLSK